MRKTYVTFTVFEQVSPEPLSANRYRIVENIWTSDGMRSRITSQTFQTLDDAHKRIEGLNINSLEEIQEKEHG